MLLRLGLLLPFLILLAGCVPMYSGYGSDYSGSGYYVTNPYTYPDEAYPPSLRDGPDPYYARREEARPAFAPPPPSAQAPQVQSRRPLYMVGPVFH